MEIIESYLTESACFLEGETIEVKGLMLHSVGCAYQQPFYFMKKWNHPDCQEACVHAFIDGTDGKIYQTLPWNHRAWHCGGSYNGTHIGVEMCEPACLSYTSQFGFTCENREEALACAKLTYDTAVELFAWLCSKYGLDPLADGVIVSHYEGYLRTAASDHEDPEHFWQGLGTSYTMDGFRRDVNAAMQA